MSQSNDQFNRTLQERHSFVKNLVKSFVKASPNNDLEKNCLAAKEFLAACEHLDAILAKPDKPAWLANAISMASTFVTNKQAQQASKFSTWIHENGRAMEEAIVPVNGDDVPFDKMYGDIRDSLNIPENFQDMIDALAQIISLNVIGYRTVNDALLKLKAVLASNKRGSQTAIFSAMDYGEFVRLILSSSLALFGGHPASVAR